MLIKDKQAKRADWRLGRIHRVTPGSDGHVRRVIVRHLDARSLVKETERTIHDLVLLYSPDLTTTASPRPSVT